MWLSPHRPPLQGITMANVISVKVSGINDVIINLAHFTNELHDDLVEVCHRITEEMQSTAEEHYAQYRGDARDIVVHDPSPIKNGYEIVATGTTVVASDGMVGNTVMFAEFGSGMTAGWHPKGAEFGAYPGSWSIHNAQQYSTFGFWEHNGERYRFIEPTRAMYYALERGKLVADEFAREVFR